MFIRFFELNFFWNFDIYVTPVDKSTDLLYRSMIFQRYSSLLLIFQLKPPFYTYFGLSEIYSVLFSHYCADLLYNFLYYLSSRSPDINCDYWYQMKCYVKNVFFVLKSIKICNLFHVLLNFFLFIQTFKLYP